MSDFVDDLVALCRYFSIFERERVCGASVTVQQCVVLQSLLGGPREVGSLAEEVGSSPSAMTRLLDGLVRRGWADRARAEADRRYVYVSLSTPGRREAERLRDQTAQTIELVLGTLPEPKRGQVLESLALVRKAMEDAREALRSCCARELRVD